MAGTKLLPVATGFSSRLPSRIAHGGSSAERGPGLGYRALQSVVGDGDAGDAPARPALVQADRPAIDDADEMGAVLCVGATVREAGIADDDVDVIGAGPVIREGLA